MHQDPATVGNMIILVFKAQGSAALELIGACKTGPLCRELPRRSEVFDPDEFMPQDDPFKRQAAVSARFAHVASPVRTYIKQDPQKLRSAAERRRLVASAHAKACFSPNLQLSDFVTYWGWSVIMQLGM